MAWGLGSGLGGGGVVVTGAVGGVGRPTAQAFASAGARVMANHNRRGDLVGVCLRGSAGRGGGSAPKRR